MRKIGVMTYCKSENYGAFLQAYALQRVLRKMGYEPSLIDYETPADAKRYALIKFGSFKQLAKSFILLPINLKRKKAFKKCLTLLNFTSKDEFYDIAIVGSDQVWNLDTSGGKVEPYFFLDGVKARKKISYAASIGKEKNVKKYKEYFKKYLPTFDAISVREQQAKEALNGLSKLPIKVAADPTLLLSATEWLDFAKNGKSIKNTDYIFAYFVGGITARESNVLKKVSDKLNLKCLSYSQFPRERKLLKYCYADSPADFLAKMRDAKLVITCSFHGVALSLMLHKNFYYFLPRAEKRSRVDNILEAVGLKDRIIETEADLDKINFDNIDYAKPQEKLNRLREESLKWLKNAIEEKNE